MMISMGFLAIIGGLLHRVVLARTQYPPVYLIRHGEKAGAEHILDLSPRGEMRAAALSAVFFPKYNKPKYGPIDVVVTQQPSDTFPIERELHTAEVIVGNNGTTPLRRFKHTDEFSLIRYLQSVVLDGVTPLLVWEHYRMPAIAIGLVLRFNRSYEQARHPIWPDDRYDILWELNLNEGTIEHHCMEILYGDLECAPFILFPPSEYVRAAHLPETSFV